MATLTQLDANNGFVAGDLDTSGYVAVIPAFQSIFFADGRDYDNYGYHKLEFHTTKIKGVSAGAAVLTYGEAVHQATSGAKGNYLGCEEVKLTLGNLTANDTPFQLGEKVTQTGSLAIGYVTYLGLTNDGSTTTGHICVCPVGRTTSTGELIDFNATNPVTGAESGAIATPSAVSAIGVGDYHFIYRTTTTEFVVGENILSTATPANYITPTASAGAVQLVYTDSAATGGTFTLTYDGVTTAAIAYDATWATITTAFVTAGLTEGDITVTGEGATTTFNQVTSTSAMILTFATTLGSVNTVTGDATNLTTTTAITSKPFTSGFTTVTAPPHWRTWKPVATYSGTTNPGIMPDGGSNIGCLCFGRIFLNSMKNPHLWFCTRVFDPRDFDSSQTDVAAATYSSVAKAGEVGNPIVAMISYKDHYLIWGCANEMWILQSDPLMGGVNRCISKATGIFSPTSYCWDDKNNLYFLGGDGIYVLSANAILNAGSPVNMTKQHIPKLISSIGLNRRTDRVAMSYDKQRYGIKVAVTQQDGEWAVNWWMDLRTGGLFPEQFAGDQDAASLYYFDSYKSSERALLIGCYDGYIRKEDEDEKDDDGSNTIESHFTIGPICADGDPRKEVGINETSLVTGEDTDGVTVDMYRADSADEVVNNILDEETALVTKTLSGDGLEHSVTERVSGRAVALKIKNETAAETFSVESINLQLQDEGRKK